MKNILITGCNRGLGLGLIRQLVKQKNPPKNIIATCRSVQKAQELQEIANKHANVKILQFDVKNFDLYEDFSKKIEAIVNDDGLNVLINNAGVSSKFTRIQFVKPEQMIDALTVNTIAPVILTKSLLPLLKQASQNNADKALSAERALVVNMSSILGSVAENKDGGLYPYRCSKAALNMASKSMSIDLSKDGILVTCLHPGWVKTDMGGTNAPMEIEDSTSQIVTLLGCLNETHNGGYYQYDGKQLPW